MTSPVAETPEARQRPQVARFADWLAAEAAVTKEVMRNLVAE